jgi:two-component system phosphate regulon sensor histidine kinase PhoR
LPVKQVDSAFAKELKKASIEIPFTVALSNVGKAGMMPVKKEFKTSPASVGFLSPYYYQASFNNPASVIFARIAPQIILSVLLVAFTIGSFIVLYRNLMTQRRLADIKNEFISNITHELKTPIATVNVAIEAMKSFNALHNPERTQEYLDISAVELQRLSMLVDRVLKLSMFEKKKIEIKKEWFDIEELAKEILATMKLQFEKQKAKVEFRKTGERFNIHADKLHMTSVIYNLLDNALKYSKQEADILVHLVSHAGFLELRVTDNGIGISKEYKSKVFEEFFRVPRGDKHNIKGYGLGLSYVKNILHQHLGFIEVESEPGKGSTFIVKLPYEEAPVIYYDRDRRIQKIPWKL